MQDGSANAKQQIVERVRQSTNILVTVNNNPSVDALSAALSLALMLNKLDKHATAVFSGATPPAINFLEPSKTFENNVDSLRDFIIALDKEKADRLRYKVEDDVVKIFITPYRTTITDKDLQFSQGDFNVDLIIALGVENRDELDKAITAHGRILHDATVATINAANQKSSLGSIDWQDSAASSLCEMLVGLSESLQANILDQQISTAMLTGIVAATERFSNQHTTPRVMTMAAQLMAAGANQQLIANNLRVETAMPKVSSPAEGSAKVKTEAEAEKGNGEMQIRHDGKANTPSAPKPNDDIPIATPAASSFNDLKQALEEASEAQNQLTEPSAPTEKPAERSRHKQVKGASRKLKEEAPKEDESYITDKPSWMGRNIEPPTLGGTLSATAEEALQSKMREEVDQRNHRLLSHDQVKSEEKQSRTPEPAPAMEFEETPMASAAPIQPPAPEPAPPSTPPMPPAPVTKNEPAQPVEPTSQPTIEQLEEAKPAPSKNTEEKPPEVNLDEARQAVNDALSAQPFDPANQPLASVGAQEFSQPAATPEPPTLPPTAQPTPATMQPAPASNEMPPLPPLPPMPDFNSLPPSPPQVPEMPPLPPAQIEESPHVTPPAPNPAPPTTPPPANPNDPKQFRIPGQ